MEFDDPQWDRLQGGYRIPYDPRNALRALEQGNGTEAAWQELWNELYHQGDVGEASYAAVPHLVRIHALRGVPDANTYALVALIEQRDWTAVIPLFHQICVVRMRVLGASWSNLVFASLEQRKARHSSPTSSVS